jgi:predicted RNase H-like HicB family nuclease
LVTPAAHASESLSTICPASLDAESAPYYHVDMQEPATTLNLTAVVTPDDDWFMARCIEVPVVSQGPTVDEALANLTEALELYFEDEPAPAPPIVRPINVRIPA